MLKRKIFAVALPIIAGATIVGSGFAAWVFAENANSASQGIGVELTEKLDIEGVDFQLSYKAKSLTETGTKEGILSKKDKISIVLDQGLNDKAGTELDKGIYFKLTTEDKKTYSLEEISVSIIDSTKKIENLNKAGYVVNFGVNINFDSTLLKAVDIKESTSWTSITGLTGETTSGKFSATGIEADSDLIAGNTVKFMFDSVSEGTGAAKFFAQNKVLKYKTFGTEAGKPTNASQYETLKTTLTNGGLIGEAATKSGMTIDLSLEVGEAK